MGALTCHLKFINNSLVSLVMSSCILCPATPEIVKEYFKWFCSIPELESPGFHKDGKRIMQANKSTPKSDEYIFLPPGLPGPFDRDIGTIERGKKTFLASLSFIGSGSESHGADIFQLYKFADVDHDNIEYRKIVIDEKELPESDLESRFRVRTYPFEVNFPEGALFNVHQGPSIAVADGVYIVWEPSVGEHKVHFEGKIKLAGIKDTIEEANQRKPAKEDHVENVTYTFKVS
jgi:hypothetical protein